MKNILKKYSDYLLFGDYENKRLKKRDNISEILAALTEGEGGLFFSDIDYNSQDRAAWHPQQHLERLFALARSFKNGSSEIDRETLLAILDGWLTLDPQCPNWWYNMIGAPKMLADAAIILWDELSFEKRTLVLSRLSRGVIFQTQRCFVETGANLLWRAGITMRYAILAGDATLLSRSVKMAAAETQYGTEGIQPDGSFFQHGRRLYSGGYGLSFINSLALMAYIVDGTPFAFPAEAVERLMKHVDGLRYMIHRGVLDYAVVGREYVRPDALKTDGLAKDLSIIEKSCGKETFFDLGAFVDALNNKTPTFEGFRYFPEAAYLSMCLEGVFISFKGAAPELLDAEIINSENFLGYNLSYGTHTTVMHTGEEYYGISPIWDYGRIPGTSMPYLTDEELIAVPDFSKRTLPIEDFGGRSDDGYATIYVTVVHEGVSATVAAFATDYGMIILGNSISDAEGRPVLTTAEQCLVVADVEGGEDEVIHGEVRYKNLDPTTHFEFTVETRRKSARRNRKANPDVQIDGKVLTVSVERTSDTYAYIIAPKSIDVSGIEVVSNCGKNQAIKLPTGRIISARGNE